MIDKALPTADPATRAVHPPKVEVRQEPLVAPIYGTSVFVFPDLETVDRAFTTRGDFVYSRMENHAIKDTRRHYLPLNSQR